MATFKHFSKQTLGKGISVCITFIEQGFQCPRSISDWYHVHCGVLLYFLSCVFDAIHDSILQMVASMAEEVRIWKLGLVSTSPK
jgi:hypothetical protein